jgi:hypothetical protein
LKKANSLLGGAMQLVRSAQVESDALSDFAKVMEIGRKKTTTRGEKASRLNLDKTSLKNGLGQLVLTVVKLLHELLERQAIRRVEAGTLTESEIERIGVTLMRQAQEIDRLRREFNLEEEDLNLDLGPLGKLL